MVFPMRNYPITFCHVHKVESLSSIPIQLMINDQSLLVKQSKQVLDCEKHVNLDLKEATRYEQKHLRKQVLMDLETENRIAAILMKETAELRQRAEREGVHVYLEQPKVRARPNSRFLTATVHGVQQTNRAVEVNEMWRVRQKELEMDDRLRERSGYDDNCSKNCGDVGDIPRSTGRRHSVNENNTRVSSSSSKRVGSSYSGEDEGLRDEEVEEFLHSRVKRGRGAVGSRMDETGPYLPPCPDYEEKLSRSPDAKLPGVVFKPEKPSLLKYHASSEEELGTERLKKAKKVCSKSLDKKHSRKHRSKEKSRGKKRERKDDKRSKH